MDFIISKCDLMKAQQKLWKYMEQSTGLVAQERDRRI